MHILALGRRGWGDPWDSLASQPSLPDRFQINERFVLSKWKKEKKEERMGEKARSTLPKVKVSIHTPPYLALENINLCHHVLKVFFMFL